jgi:predicted ATP-grasp superfamily ATP-dependent carboligase
MSASVRVIGVFELLGSLRLKCRVEGFQGGTMIIDANELRGLADECVAAAAKCNDPDAAAKLLEIATKILELVRREMKPDVEQPFGGPRSAG